MSLRSILKSIMGVERTAIDGVEYDKNSHQIVISVRPYARSALRCPECGRRCPRYDRGVSRRRWRSLDLGTIKTYLEADTPRITCKAHGIRTAAVPWARPKSRFTHLFED